MSAFQRFFHSRGKSGKLLAIKHDPHMDMEMDIYYIGLDEHFGIVRKYNSRIMDMNVCPVNTWHPSSLFAKGELEELMSRAKAGEVIDIEMPGLQRKKLLLDISFLHKRKTTEEQKPVLKRRRLNV